MILQRIDKDFSICRVAQIDPAILNNDFTFISKTDNELSIICQTEFVPDNCTVLEDDWSCFRIAEDASFEKFGMIAFLTRIIAGEKTGVLVVATFDTDYLFVKKDKFPSVHDTLVKQGCQFL